jgi:hypothetical protein
VSSVAGGGSCGQGATSAVFGKYTTVSIGGTPGHFNAYQFTATVIAGGVGSVIAGGKFKNGAETAAFGYLFNSLAHMLEGRAADRLIGAYLQSQFPDLDIRLQQRAYWPWQDGYGIIDMVVTADGTDYHFEIKKYTYAASESMDRYWEARHQLQSYVLSQPNAAVGDWGRFFGDMGNWAHFEGGVRFSSGRTFGGGIVFGPDSYSPRSGLIFYQFFQYQPSSNGPPLWIDYTKRRR